MWQKPESFPVRGGVNVLPLLLPLPLGRRGPHTRTGERPPGAKGGHWLRENEALRPTTAKNQVLPTTMNLEVDSSHIGAQLSSTLIWAL